MIALLLWIGVSYWLGRPAESSGAHQGSPSANGPGVSWRVALVVALVVSAVVLLLYFPPFLSRYGPYGEDKYFLSAILRVLDGQRPYVDFEFIYGPLLIVPVASWFSAFGYSLQSYYWLLAIVEAATFGALVVGLARLIPDRRTAFVVFGIAALLLVNDNLGLSWIALRRLLPVATLLVYSMAGSTFRGGLSTTCLLGLLVVLSLEFALAVVVGLAAIGAVDAIGRRSLAPLIRATVTILSGLVLGLALAVAMLGADVTAWLVATVDIFRLRGAGEAGFPFQASFNALAVLTILFLASARFGNGLRNVHDRPMAPGDRLLVGALSFALVAMKSAFGRADMYHLVPPVLGLVATAAWPLEPLVFRHGPRSRSVMTAAIVLLCLTWAPGLLGAGRLWFQGLALGAQDVLTGRPSSSVLPRRSRAGNILAGSAVDRPDLAALAERLAEPPWANTPVLFYEQLWGLDRMIGVPKPRGAYPNDDYLVSDSRGATLWRFLEQTPDALVLIDRATWRHLSEAAPLPPAQNMFWIGGSRSRPVRILERWSSAHFGTAVLEEAERKRARWARTVGAHLPSRYQPAAEFGDILLLKRRPN